MLFLFSRIIEYDQTTLVPIDSEDTDVLYTYAASIINGEHAIRRKPQCKGPLLENNNGDYCSEKDEFGLEHLTQTTQNILFI